MKTHLTFIQKIRGKDKNNVTKTLFENTLLKVSMSPGSRVVLGYCCCVAGDVASAGVEKYNELYQNCAECDQNYLFRGYQHQ